MLPQIRRFKRAALDLLFPQKCLGCGEEGDIICGKCLRALPKTGFLTCPKCGRPQLSNILCPACINWQASIDYIRAPLKFDGLVREAIHQFKYKNLRCLVSPMADILKEYCVAHNLTAEVLVPVPLHPGRLKERGYNQSGLLAQSLGKLINLPVNEDCLVRTKYLLPQVHTKSLEERRQNVQTAFTCRNASLAGKSVLLIDDVATSGSTLESCAAALKVAGATAVYGLALAREI